QGFILALSNFSYVNAPLNLGELSGNRFSIVLRNISREKEIDCPGATMGLTPGADQVRNNEGTENGGKCDGAVMEEASEVTEEEEGRRLREIVEQRCCAVRDKGFVNYFGLQRFGSGGSCTSGTGLAMVKGDWKEAVKLIMKPRFGENEATHEAKVYYQKNPSDPQGVLKRLPFFMDTEKLMMETLVSAGANSHLTALRAIPKNLQLMYLHAFQSLLWNLVATWRVNTFGVDKVVAGDLVIAKGTKARAREGGAEEEDAESVSKKARLGMNSSEEKDDKVNGSEVEGEVGRGSSSSLPAVHVVTEEEAREGTFDVLDIVLPMPGTGIMYPTNGAKECFGKALEDRGLTFDCFNSSSEGAYHLGGAYRRLLVIPQDMKWEIKCYEDNTLHLINTDIDTLLDIDDARIAAEEEKSKKDQHTSNVDVAPDDGSSQPPVSTANSDAVVAMDEESNEPVLKEEVLEKEHNAGTKSGKFKALCLEFTLPTASYATMCVREITKQTTTSSYHTSLNDLPAGKHPGSAPNGAQA
ncbi:unnamed protein product, partial [Choristocarpus tenellus]